MEGRIPNSAIVQRFDHNPVRHQKPAVRIAFLFAGILRQRRCYFQGLSYWPRVSAFEAICQPGNWRIGLVAEPWWVNLAILVPLVAYFSWRRPVPITAKQLMILGVFAGAFGFLDAAVVVYLRAAARISRDVVRLYQQSPTIGELPPSLLTLEAFREAATLLMLSCAALLTSVKGRARCRFPLGLCPLGHGLLCRSFGRPLDGLIRSQTATFCS